MKHLQPVQTAAVWAIAGAAAGAVGSGLARGDWAQSFLYAIPAAAVIFMLAWALLGSGNRR